MSMTLTLPALPFLARFRRPAVTDLPDAGPMVMADEADDARVSRAAAMDLMEHCPEALASESGIHAMMYCYSGRY